MAGSRRSAPIPETAQTLSPAANTLPTRNGRPSGVRTGVRATTRFVSGSIRWIRGSSSTEAQSWPRTGVIQSQLPVRTWIVACTAPVAGSRRRIRPAMWSAIQIEPKASTICTGLSVTCSVATTRGWAGSGVASPRSQRVAAATAATTTASAIAPASAGVSQRWPRRARDRRAAPHVALGRLLQLQPEPGHEVVAHVPILRRTAASPRLTRLRTTDSEVASESAISS